MLFNIADQADGTKLGFSYAAVTGYNCDAMIKSILPIFIRCILSRSPRSTYNPHRRKVSIRVN